MLGPKFIRWVLALILAYALFAIFYSPIRTPALFNFRNSSFLKSVRDRLSNASSSVAITETISVQNQTCPEYLPVYLNVSDKVLLQRHHSSSLHLYQPPCRLANFSDFRFLVNKDVCGDGDVYMMILVGSHPSNLKIRNVLRKTISNPDIKNLTFKIAFMFGQVTNVTMQRELDEESKVYGDIIQGSFIDAYHNVTLRDLMGLRWVWQNCPQARYVMRMDDDVSVDIYSLIDVIEQRYDQMANTVACFQLLIDLPVWRSGRYYVSYKEHLAEKYDTYCQGWMYLVVPRMAYNLDLASLRNEPYWVNDAYITETLIKALGQEPLDLKVNYTEDITNMTNAKDKQSPPFIVGPVGSDHELLLSLHKNYQKHARAHGIPKFNSSNDVKKNHIEPFDNFNTTSSALY